MCATETLIRQTRRGLDPCSILGLYYRIDTPLHRLLLDHSRRVAEKALAVADLVAHLEPDRTFIHEAAMLHDLGVYQTHAPRIHCHGRRPYVHHGVIGRSLLEFHGLARHALVCERHVGAGISRRDILDQGLGLPPRDMLPLSLEEQIICYADKFFSKTCGGEQLSVAAVVRELEPFGPEKVERFLQWHALFEK